ncbi:MAG: hypothetical protein LAT81_09165 [Oceanicaulis sp.]|nr:hypothetical protein [Oceanicaulis sp.]
MKQKWRIAAVFVSLSSSARTGKIAFRCVQPGPPRRKTGEGFGARLVSGL